jgi:hypothetical protein
LRARLQKKINKLYFILDPGGAKVKQTQPGKKRDEGLIETRGEEPAYIINPARQDPRGLHLGTGVEVTRSPYEEPEPPPSRKRTWLRVGFWLVLALLALLLGLVAAQ